MRCFRHPPNEAVGVCKHCSKGVCPECVVDVGEGIACRGPCEESVRAVSSLVARNVRGPDGAVLYTMPIIYGLFGMSFLGWALAGGPVFLLVLSAVFLFGGGMSIFNIRKFQREARPAQKPS